MKFNKFKVQHLGHGNLTERIPAEKELGVLVDKQLDMSQLCAVGKVHPRLCKTRCGQQVRKDDSAPVFSCCETQPGAFSSALGSPKHERYGPVREGSEEAMKKIRGMGYLCYEDETARVVKPGEEKAWLLQW